MRNRAAVIIIENNMVALIKRIKYGEEYFVFPGGGIKKGEIPIKAAVREAYEELGVHIKINQLFNIVNYDGTQFYYLADIIGGDFGTGKGEEYFTKGSGLFKPMWVKLNKIQELDVRPKEIAAKVYSYSTEL